ncbi:hypothetical protein [Chryseobacterium koreense]|uniref:hypothetical protein n=1 Tax=Chryseobacterium koreense TaxID=232216 RepID=UPI0026EA51BC|nr:hypothetical protein [Chryseobacterium koreense]
MKKTIFLLLALFFWKANAQFFSGEILIRDQSIYYLNQIYVTNITEHNTVYTDYYGSFRIPAKPGDIIRFTSIVTDRKDVEVTAENLENSRNIVELKVAYYDIQEVVISRFKPTGNLRKDVASLKNGEKELALQKVIGLPAPKGNGLPPELPVASLANGGLSFSLESIYDILSGERKKKERAQEYEKMNYAVTAVKNYFGKTYFSNLKIPDNLIDNFLQFVYTSDNFYSMVENKKIEVVGIYIEKYLPVYQRRLRNSHLIDAAK